MSYLTLTKVLLVYLLVCLQTRGHFHGQEIPKGSHLKWLNLDLLFATKKFDSQCQITLKKGVPSVIQGA